MLAGQFSWVDDEAVRLARKLIERFQQKNVSLDSMTVCGLGTAQAHAQHQSLEEWLKINTEYAEKWPNITRIGTPPPDADEWRDKPDKKQFLSENPGEGT